MSAKELDINVKVKINDSEHDFADKDIAEVLRKLIQQAIDEDITMGDYVHEEIFTNLITFEVSL